MECNQRGRVVWGASCVGDKLSYYINRGRVVGGELSGDELSVGKLTYCRNFGKLRSERMEPKL